MKKHIASYFLALCTVVLLTVTQARADMLDPVGDTFGSGSVRHDITQVSAGFTASALTFTVNFVGPVAPASARSALSLFGYIDIDADQNPLTGIESAIAFPGVPGPAIALGGEYFIDLYSEEFLSGRVEVFNNLFDVMGSVPVIFGANSFSVTIPLALLGGDDGLVNYGVLVGTRAEATDRAPNGALPATSTPVPEPATLLLLGTGLAGIGARMMKRRKLSPDA